MDVLICSIKKGTALSRVIQEDKQSRLHQGFEGNIMRWEVLASDQPFNQYYDYILVCILLRNYSTA